MKRLCLIPIFCCMILLPDHFGQYMTAKDSDPEAISLLEKASQNMAGTHTQISFSLKYSYPGQEGTPAVGVLYQSGKSYRVELDDYTIISNGKSRWVYLRKANEVNLYNESNGQDWLSPQDFLNLHLANDLVFILAGTSSDGTTTIEAKPLKGRFVGYSKFTIQLKQGKLASVKTLGKDGTRQEMKIGAITHPATLDTKKLYNFNASQYPGVFVEDLRID